MRESLSFLSRARQALFLPFLRLFLFLFFYGFVPGGVIHRIGTRRLFAERRTRRQTARRRRRKREAAVLRALGVCGANIWCVREMREEEEEKKEAKNEREREKRGQRRRSANASRRDHVYPAPPVLPAHARSTTLLLSHCVTHICLALQIYLYVCIRTHAPRTRRESEVGARRTRVDAPLPSDSMRLKRWVRVTGRYTRCTAARVQRPRRSISRNSSPESTYRHSLWRFLLYRPLPMHLYI